MPRHNNEYLYDNQSFSSRKELARYVGINEKTITARLNRGLTIEQACEKRLYNCKYYNINGEQKSLSQICRDENKNEDLVRNRLKYGYSLEKALNKPKKIAKQGLPIVVNGILYNSISEAIRKLHLEHKESTIRSRLYAGKNPDEAFYFE